MQHDYEWALQFYPYPLVTLMIRNPSAIECFYDAVTVVQRYVDLKTEEKK